MEVEIPAPLSVAPPIPAIPEETENIEMNQLQPVEQQPFITSPLNDGQMLPPGTPVHKSNEPIINEDQVLINYLMYSNSSTDTFTLLIYKIYRTILHIVYIIILILS